MTPDERAALREHYQHRRFDFRADRDVSRLLDALDAETARADALLDEIDNDRVLLGEVITERDEARDALDKIMGDLIDRDEALDRVRALVPQTFADGVEFFYAEDVRDAIDGGASCEVLRIIDALDAETARADAAEAATRETNVEHSREVGSLLTEVERLSAAIDNLSGDLDRTEAERDEARAEVERLTRDVRRFTSGQHSKQRTGFCLACHVERAIEGGA